MPIIVLPLGFTGFQSPFFFPFMGHHHHFIMHHHHFHHFGQFEPFEQERF